MTTTKHNASDAMSVAGGVCLPSHIRGCADVNGKAPDDELGMRLYSLQQLHPNVEIRFRQEDLAAMDESKKQLLLDDFLKMLVAARGMNMKTDVDRNSASPPCYPRCCPILEQTADGVNVGRCWATLDGFVCPRHGDVELECEYFRASGGKGTLENKMRERKNMPLLGSG